MRQCDWDEVAYTLYDATRRWRRSELNLMASGKIEPYERWVRMGAKELADRLRDYEIYDDVAQPPLGRDAIAALFAAVLIGWPLTLRRRLASPISEGRREARIVAAISLAEALDRFTILRDSPPPPPFMFLRTDGGTGLAPREEIG